MRDDAINSFDEDTLLMLEVKKGDHQAYARLYEKYAPAVKGYVGQHDGRCSRDDLVQEVFTRIWSHRDQYQPTGSVKSYLLGISANVLREDQTRIGRHSRVDLRELESIVDTESPSPPLRAQSTEQLEALRTLIAGLPAAQRQAVEMVYLSGLPPSKALQQLGGSRNALRISLSRARRKLRRLISSRD